MDPINIIAGLNIIASFAANLSGARLGLKSTLTAVRDKPVSYLQKLPLFLSAFTLIALILGLFQVATLEYSAENQPLRLSGLAIYLCFSWIQIWSYRTLGNYYSQEILIYKDHKLITSGPFRFLRHPQYLSQILLDLGGGIATLSWLVLLLTILEVPFIIMRASLEEKLLAKHFKDAFSEYRKKSGFMIPFIG
jgi:protein-S-isoprenylcysteine O-methyltransferase Ste14